MNFIDHLIYQKKKQLKLRKQFKKNLIFDTTSIYQK